jgi:hypothetical protein
MREVLKKLLIQRASFHAIVGVQPGIARMLHQQDNFEAIIFKLRCCCA